MQVIATMCLAAIGGVGTYAKVAVVTLPEDLLARSDGLFESRVIEPTMEWDELVLSWNVPADAPHLTIEARAVLPDRTTRWYRMAEWGPDSRTSVKDQKDADGEVQTDILKLAKSARGVQIRVQAASLPTGRFYVSLANTALKPLLPTRPKREAWGRLIEVPLRSQMSYPNGNVLCSPTSVSMVLWHWANVLGRPELNKDVPDVVNGVYDPAWPGTGNWSFNAAFAGSLPGMVAYAARLQSIHDLEAWIAAGVPVVASVSYDLLKGKGRKGRDDGHLVVVVGFGKEGDPIFNDPGRGREVRQTYRRGHFKDAWDASGRTVYLIYPEEKRGPEGGEGRWAD